MSGRVTWIVRRGDLYFGGLGKSFCNEACIGWVLTRIREHAKHFEYLDAARKTAEVIDGQVYKVLPEQEKDRPAATGTAPEKSIRTNSTPKED